MTVRRSPPRVPAVARVVLGLVLGALAAPGGALPPPESPLPGQATLDPARRPRTCLVLSGGGARGAAHVGVLKALEELRVPVDCVVGTSMGSIVGGLYASGISPASMDTTLRAIDWVDVFDDSPPRGRDSFRRKQNDRLSLLPFEIGFGAGGLRTATGLVVGQKIHFVLWRLALHTSAIQHFDDLRLPFRAVASDLASGEAVVLEDVPLATAMRASMAVPGVFSPVEVAGRPLVDGGMVANLPVEVAFQELRAERVLAVDLGSEEVQAADVTASIFNVINQAVGLQIQVNVARSRAALGDDDVHLLLDLGDLGSGDFRRVGDGIDRGQAETRAMADLLHPLRVSEQEFAAHLERQRLPGDGAMDPVRIDELVVTGSARVDSRQITGRIETRPGTLLDLEVLEADLERIYQIGEFELVGFALESSEDYHRLVIETRDKSWADAGYLRSGLTFSADFEGESQFLALANYRLTQLNARGAEWETLITGGDNNTLVTELFQPLDFTGRSFVRPRFTFQQDQFQAGGPLAVRVDFEAFIAGVDLGLQLGDDVELSAGLEVNRVDVDTEFGGVDADQAGLRFRATIDNLDDVDFPRTGTFISADLFRSLEDLGSDDSYERFIVELTQPISFGPHTLLANLTWGTGFGSDIPLADEFELGGFANLSGLQPRQLRGDELRYASLGYYRRFFGNFYVGGALEVGNLWPTEDLVDEGDLITSGLVFVGLDTLVGPVYVGYGAAEEEEDSFYLFLGRAF